MLEFKFERAISLAAALERLNTDGSSWRVIAGGTDLIVRLRSMHGSDPQCEGLIDISGLRELGGIEVTEDQVAVGALTSFSDLLQSNIICRETPILAEMASCMGTVQIRNRATLGGNIVNASPCADSVPPLLVLGAQVELCSVAGTRRLPLEQFLIGPERTALEKNELLTRVFFPRIKPPSRWGYFKLGRRSSAAIARISVATLRTMSEPESATSCRIAVGATTPYPMRLPRVEQFLNENGWSIPNIMEAASLARDEVMNVTGLRWSTAYKLPVTENLVRRTLERLI